MSGDTVFYDRWRIEYKFKLKTDTLIKTDTVFIQKIATITKTVAEKKPLSWWQKTLMYGGVIFMLLVIYTIYKTIKKHLKPI